MIHHFFQISDLHLSVHFDPTRKPDFYRFCTEVVDTIKPSVILATGDLTDARTRGPMGSKQYEEEWRMYADVIKQSNVTKKAAWLDMRGNHDDFNVYDWADPQNFYRKYSVQGHHRGHYSYNHIDGISGDTYSFIGVDACLQPGPKRPFNFIGVLHESDIVQLEQLKKNATDSGAAMILWFGHYPTSSLATPTHGLREIINGPYFCGHFHIKQLYATQATGFLEVEVADWRASRTYRVAAVDHGLFSFTDVSLGDDWPVILITNPKPTMFAMSKIEPLYRIQESTHIRALVFSNQIIKSVQVMLDDDEWADMVHVSNSSLYVHAWSPLKYPTGLHLITVRARDEKGHERIERHQYSFDGSRPQFGAKARFLLRLTSQIFFKTIFFTVILAIVLPLLSLRLLDYVGKGRGLRLGPDRTPLNRLLAKFYLLASNNSLFVPAVGIPLYATFGPMLVGHVVDGHWGTVFVWGMFVDGSYLPGGFTYIMAILFLVLIHIPMVVILAHCVHIRYNQLATSKVTAVKLPLMRTLCHVRNFFVLFILILHFLYSLLFAHAYGPIAWFLGFFYTWTLGVYICMWRRTMVATSKDFTESARPKLAQSTSHNVTGGDGKIDEDSELIS